LRLVGLELRGSPLGDGVVQPAAGQDVDVWLPPAAYPTRLRDSGQDLLLLLTNPVLGEQVPQIHGADAAPNLVAGACGFTGDRCAGSSAAPAMIVALPDRSVMPRIMSPMVLAMKLVGMRQEEVPCSPSLTPIRL